MPRKPTAQSPVRGKTSARRPSVRKPLGNEGRDAASNGNGAAMQWPAPASLAAAWTQFAEQMQRASEQAWQGLRHDVEIQADEAQQTDSAQQLAGAPIGLAVDQMTRWMQLSSQLAASLLDVQAVWFKQVEAATAQMLAPLVTHHGRIAFGSAQDIVEPPGPNGPMQAVWSAQKLWSESTKAWLSAMSHDLQDGASAR